MMREGCVVSGCGQLARRGCGQLVIKGCGQRARRRGCGQLVRRVCGQLARRKEGGRGTGHLAREGVHISIWVAGPE